MYEYGNPMYNPAIMPYLGIQQQQRHVQRQEVVKVNGENGANAITLAPNSSMLALDMSGTILWAITTDGAGYKTVTPFDIIPHEVPKQPDYTSLEERIAAIERKMNDEHSGNSEQKQSSTANYTAYTANSSNDRHNQRNEKSTGNA